jgi:type IV secretion system protein VirB6
MGFFAELQTWLDTQLNGYISTYSAKIGAALEPAAVTLAVFYVMAWGYMQLTGKIEEPFIVGLKRILTVAFVLGVGFKLWLYNSVIVDIFYNGPTQLAAQAIGAPTSAAAVDTIFDSGSKVAEALLAKAGLMSGSLIYALAGFLVFVIFGILCVYIIFLLSLSKVALSVLLAIGPLFIFLLLFNASRRYFELWISQMATYGFVALLTIMVMAVLMHLLQQAEAQATNAGPAIQVVQAIRVCLAGFLVIMVLTQVSTMAHGLGHGFAVQTNGLVGRGLKWGLSSGWKGIKLMKKKIAAA